MHTHTPPAVRLTIVEAIGPFVIIEVGKSDIAPVRFYAENRDVTPAVRLNNGLLTFEDARLAVCDALETYARALKAERSCTCGAHEYRGCFCNLTVAEFMKSPHAKSI